MEVYSLFELNEHIRRVIALNFQEAVWVRCEIAQARQSRGHFYLELVEKRPQQTEIIAQVQAVIWARTASTLQRKLKHLFHEIIADGMETRLKVRVDFHERYGLKLIIEDIDPDFTLGNIETRRREIIETLYREGYIGRNSRLPLPIVLQRIAVLSAENAAGYQDFRKHLLHNPYRFRYWIDLYPVALQGAQVESECLAALEQIARARHHYDCVVLIRGGGSRLDLAAFDNYAIGKAIAVSPLPVFTGIGHEIDHTVADAVAHTSLKTPTAVAGFLTEINLRYDSIVEQTFDSIGQTCRQKLVAHQLEIRHLSELLRHAPASALARHRALLDQLPAALRETTRQYIRQQNERIGFTAAVLESLDPEAVLQRGFSITTHNGTRVQSATSLHEHDELITYFYEGNVRSIVTS